MKYMVQKSDGNTTVISAILDTLEIAERYVKRHTEWDKPKEYRYSIQNIDIRDDEQ